MAKINSSPEKFLAQGQLGKDLVKSSQRHLADGALQLVQINGRPVKPLKLGNNEARVAAVLEHTAVVGGGILNDNPVFIEHDIASSIIAPEHVPESYFELQEKIARERGYGNVDITPELKDEAIRTLRADQEESLTSWSNYLRDESNRNTYQDWFKVYAWESVKKLGDFDKQKMAFRRRQASTTGVYPELDAEALAYVYDKIDSHLLNGVISDDERISQLLQSGNFGKLYAHAVQEAGIAVSPELRETIRGSWKKYSQIQGSYQPDYRFGDDNEAVDRTVVDNVTAMELSESLQGHRTGWCTAGTRTAAHQLSGGDFYVYYSEDKNGDETVPRVAIRMEDGQVAEVRGIEPGQGLESVMVDITERQLRTLPGGGDYFERLENMKHMTDIYNRQHAGQELTADDIMFLRFTKGAGEGFGQYADPRLAELLKGRDFGADLKLIIQAGADPTALADQLISQWQSYVVADNLTAFVEAGATIDPTVFADQLISQWQSDVVADNLTAFVEAGADPTALADQLISQGQSDVVVKNINAFLKAGASREELKTMLQSGYDA